MICGVKHPTSGAKCNWTVHGGHTHSWGLVDKCPDCQADLIVKWSGLKCSECPYWFCY